MSTCLGLYIEENIIKYAKATKERDQVKIDAFGVKFYENLDQVIKQIVEETFSYKTPISINLSEEMYNYFQVFALLSKKDLPRAIKTEFESFCTEKNYNQNVFETRYAITPNTQDKEKLKVIHISENKMELNKILQNFTNYKLQNIVPLPMTISNVSDFEENCLIVNIEENTTITTIIDQNVYDVTKMEIGSRNFLEKINAKENSYQKSYEICKETTIYTSEGKELTDNETSYLEYIMPTLYEIVGNVRKIMNESVDRISKVYITGVGALINNIDLYFEEYLEGVKCEILKPKFIKVTPDINIKDYIEVNSAISLALSGLGVGINGMNFKKVSTMDKLKEIFTIEVGSKKSQVGRKNPPKMVSLDFDQPLDKIEKNMIRGTAALAILLVVYGGFSLLINKQLEDKTQEANESISSTTAQIGLVNKDIQSVQSRTSDYTKKISALQESSKQVDENNRQQKAIPNLLNRLMYVMPSEVQITSIKNDTSSHITISAQSSSYAQLGYLTASIKSNGILTSVVSSSGQKQNNLVTIKIEGDLP